MQTGKICVFDQILHTIHAEQPDDICRQAARVFIGIDGMFVAADASESSIQRLPGFQL